MTESTTSPPASAALPIRGARVLIAGAASLVGSHTAEHLLRAGAREVLLLDNFAFGTPEAIAHLRDDPRVRIVRADITRLHELLTATQGVDGVLLLAAHMTLGFAQTPWQAIDVNVRGAQNLIEACRLHRVRKLVFASSNAVYGYGPGVQGALHEDLPLHSVGAPPAAVLYGASKIIGEQLCRQAWQQHGLAYVALRYSTVYGERQHYRAANALYIMDTYDRVRRGERPVLPGDGSDSKHFVYVGDVARANLAAFESAATDVAVNISGVDPITTRALVQLVLDYCGSRLTPQFQPDPPGTVRLTAGGAFHIPHDKAGALIGWRPEVPMREGVRRLLAWREAQART
ncbi:NAD-dependent epimerase/dehydratase family protein [Verminephrobacter aporrectodeae]|uniref:NAD-dependent epimerase/dehydratase family protein n=1 Tax=Verminephrobacter aporrectodeae subsp. tuberculatae TaxID=1110392 RepID=A0ABT3KZ41_9BURK|nr:NAD-dependent epimerase/dehydratase family protein [Verminephrobacter aporrectodeae]MCW5323608.1 NAD-dependent epimerase/dehydratase family protein [Verminephrobacter aporrectodeae subsp. tuberculatae]MCW8174390.1 NAD-dependent epimerase/dehydratase family protein [Verminephrobacter aporrectodeae subsp. tuberculatae]MCW8201729.1 NAD-dependent epimerase/dehydratase family protein [Verminephrobacter aporrectodeae subsp. tuberculatae]MCW8207285.1 NAD-dependent epimerase/dehydratase family prote